MSIYLILPIVVNCHLSIIFNIKTWAGGGGGLVDGASLLLSQQCLSQTSKFSLQNHNLSLKQVYYVIISSKQKCLIIYKIARTAELLHMTMKWT